MERFKRNKECVYLSGPVTGTDDYLDRFAEGERLWSERGFIVINPAKICAQMPLESLYSDYMKVCLELLKLADSVAMLSNWERSKGARIERDYALAVGMKVYY